jgi:hypothetical protein
MIPPPIHRFFFTAIAAFALSISCLLAADDAGTVLVSKQLGKLPVIKAFAPVAAGQIALEEQVADGWQPVDVKHFKARRGHGKRLVLFRLPDGVSPSGVRVVAYTGEKFAPKIAAKATRGNSTFARQSLESTDNSGTSPVLAYATGGLAAVAAPETADASKAAVVESDIFKLVGDRLFFFNQYRGLQSIDLSDPLSPARTGTLRLPASGEQFFDLSGDGSSLALLGRSNAVETAGKPVLYLLDTTSGKPTKIAELVWEGWVIDSRLIGNVLYAIAQEWASGVSPTGVSGWHSKIVLHAVDLSDPANPVEQPSLEFAASQGILQASGGKLLVGTNDGWGTNVVSRVHVIDLSAGPTLSKSVPVKGRIEDSFKIGTSGDALIAVTLLSKNWSDRETWVESFPLSGADTAPLAQLEIPAARGESLHATRIDGPLLYVVTFRNIDPLFVIDLSDPAHPTLAGQLEIPGWSTYIQPMGDRLVTVGIEGSRATVSLFDVSDIAAPALLSRLPLGSNGSWSWSEANYDEKAVQFFPGENLLFAPFQTWGANGVERSMAVISIGADQLSTVATIAHQFDARRGAVLGKVFLSISGQELLIVSRENAGTGIPDVAIPLAWTTDRVIPLSGYLVQIENGQTPSYYWYGRSMIRPTSGANSTLRVTPDTDPDDLVNEVDLGDGFVVGALTRDDRLYVAQWVLTANGPILRTSVFGLDAIPDLPLLGTLDHSLDDVDASAINLEATQALWPEAGRLVWYLPGQNLWWGWWGRPIFLSETPVAPDAGIVAASSTRSLGSIDNPKPPVSERLSAVLCPITLDPAGDLAEDPIPVNHKDGGRSVSAAFADEGFVFFSFDTQALRDPKPSEDPNTGLLRKISIKRSIPVNPGNLRSWLQVVDLRDGNNIVRHPVSIPGRLLGACEIDARGAILITDAAKHDGEGRAILAAAYDGIAARVIDQEHLDIPTWSATTFDGSTLYLSKGADAPGVAGFTCNTDSGKIEQVADWSTETNPETLTAMAGQLLASNYGKLETATITDSGDLEPGESFDLPVNLWLRVERATLDPLTGIWIPAGAYGVEFLDWETPPAAGSIIWGTGSIGTGSGSLSFDGASFSLLP